MALKTDISVLVVGGGPTGLTMACELKRRGVNCRVIDKLPHATDKSKALVLHARTVELLDNMGIAEKFIPLGVRGHGASIFAQGKRIVHLSFDELESKFPFALMIPQSDTEAGLNEALSTWGVKVERPVELVGFTQTSNCVTATLKHPDGSEEIVTCDYIVGCDGSHSTVRHTLDLPFEGRPYAETFALADVHVKWEMHDDEVIAFLDEMGAIAFFPMRDHRFRILMEVKGEKRPDEAPTLEDFQAVCAKHVPGKCVLSDAVWLAYFKIHRRQVEDYRVQRAFLCGDAAHIHSPVGGQGMNTGMQDAINLAWKLALVVKGEAPDSLLDSYQQERHPVAKALLGGTDLATKAAFARNPVAQSIRNALGGMLMSLEVVQQRMMKNGSMLAVNYRGSKIVGQSHFHFGSGPAPGDRAPESEVRLLGESEEQSLYDVFRGTSHTLLLFADANDPDASYVRLKEFASSVKDAYGDLIRTHIVCPDDITYHRYGANHECLYLIRPDTFIGFRSQPTDFEALQKHLEPILKVVPQLVS